MELFDFLQGLFDLLFHLFNVPFVFLGADQRQLLVYLVNVVLQVAIVL